MSITLYGLAPKRIAVDRGDVTHVAAKVAVPFRRGLIAPRPSRRRSHCRLLPRASAGSRTCWFVVRYSQRQKAVASNHETLTTGWFSLAGTTRPHFGNGPVAGSPSPSQNAHTGCS